MRPAVGAVCEGLRRLPPNVRAPPNGRVPPPEPCLTAYKNSEDFVTGGKPLKASTMISSSIPSNTARRCWRWKSAPTSEARSLTISPRPCRPGETAVQPPLLHVAVNCCGCGSGCGYRVNLGDRRSRIATQIQQRKALPNFGGAEAKVRDSDRLHPSSCRVHRLASTYNLLRQIRP